jgi:hypothetical protein
VSQGRKKARSDRKSAEKNPSLKQIVALENGTITPGIPTGAGNKTHDRAGWFVDDEGYMLTRNSKGAYRRSQQNVLQVQKWAK